MKHPELPLLQDYFENALEAKIEKRVKDHVENCDHCTNILMDFTFIETRVKADPAPVIPQVLEARILREGAELLKSKQQFKEFAVDWKKNIFPEIRIPALQ